MVSQGMSLFINNLQGNWNFIERFLNDPKSLIKEFALKEDEKEALLARDTQQLARLGVDEKLAMFANSGAHSRACSGNCGGGSDWNKQQ